jgi:crotonobetainyl-CoA:carnitine CoA-transferase CaiB-like acyl-CoA transferase
MKSKKSGPLSSMKVLDLSQQLPGPYATQLLASLGAKVTKVEPPTGDAGRHLDLHMFNNVNAGKDSITLDLKSEVGKATLYKLIPSFDVFVEGFRPTVVDRLGCSYKILEKINPKIVYCSITGFGQHGPLSRRPTHDISLQSLAQALPSDLLLNRIGVPWVDLATGTTAALAITALWHSGDGGYLDMSMLDSALAWARVKPEAVDSLEPTYGTVKTKDNKFVVIAILEDDMWSRLCKGLGWSDWEVKIEFKEYGERRKHAHVIRDRLEKTIGQIASEKILEISREFDLPIELMNSQDSESEKQINERSGGHPCVPLPVDLQVQLGTPPKLQNIDLTFKNSPGGM